MDVDWVKYRYNLEFKSMPEKVDNVSNNKSALSNEAFLLSELDRWVELGILEEVAEKPYIINPLSVVMSNKLRVVYDCRFLNPHLEERHVKLEDLNIVSDLLSPNCYGATADLDSGYWQVKLHPDHKTFFGCHVKNLKTGRFI